MLDAPGAEMPKRNGRINTHVSVIRPEELERVGNPDINEIGKTFSIQTGKLVETNPVGWDEMDRVWFMQVKSPELIKLRRSYGLPDMPKKGRKTLGFHITVAVRRKGVLAAGNVAKQAEFFTDSDWEAVPKIAQISASVLQEAVANDAKRRLGNPGGSGTIERLGAIAQLWSGKNVGIPNSPSALATALTLGILGSGVGYGIGTLSGGAIDLATKAGIMAPGTVDKRKIRRTLTLGGAALGPLAGALHAAGNYRAGKPLLTGAFLNDRHPLDNPLVKQSMYNTSGAVFDADTFARLINEDPTVRKGLDPRERAMATGLVMGAKYLPGRPNSSLVSPVDIGRMAVGMGSGYASGALVGRMLGSLMGLSQPAQDRIIQGGMFAGAVKNMLPLAFPGY